MSIIPALAISAAAEANIISSLAILVIASITYYPATVRWLVRLAVGSAQADSFSPATGFCWCAVPEIWPASAFAFVFFFVGRHHEFESSSRI